MLRAVVLFTLAGLLFLQPAAAQCTLTTVGPLPGAGALGAAVACTSETLLIGDPSGGPSGVAYRYHRVGLLWLPEAPLTPETGAGAASFGAAVAVRGDELLVDELLVGAPTHSGPMGGSPQRGAVYRLGNASAAPTPLTAPGSVGGDLLGSSVAWGSERFAAGAPGASGNAGSVAVFVASTATWEQTVAAADPQSWAQFGSAVAMAGEAQAGSFLAVGAPGADGFHGAVYLFERSGSTWTQIAKLTATGSQAGDQLGRSLVLRSSGSQLTVIAGAPGHDTGGVVGSGRVISFERVSSTVWNEVALVPPVPEVDAEFGASLALEGDRLLVGSSGQSNYQGAGTLFVDSNGAWLEEATVTATLGNFAEAGEDVAFADGLAWLGARLAPGGGAVQGFVVVDRDCNSNGSLDRCDLLAGSADDSNGNSVPDLCEQFVRGDTNGDGSTALNDVVVLLTSLFLPWGDPLSCLAAADVNADGSINLSDGVFLLNVLFVPGTPPVAAPWPDCGIDSAAVWSCEVPSLCP